MKVTLFGATGKTGPYLIREGLKRGFEICVFARSSSSFESQDVQVVRGGFADIDRLQAAVRGSDAVISALGPSKFPHPSDLPITRATEAVIMAMMRERVSRLVAVSTGTAADPGDGFDLKIRLPAALIKLAMPGIFQDIVGLARAIRVSELNWTMVRAGLLRNRPATDHLNVGLYGNTKHTLILSREDLAKFMFDQVQSPRYQRQAPGVSSA